MAGNVAGGKRAAVTNKSRHGDSFYSDIGKIGGKLGKTGGFGSKKVGADGKTGAERASEAGAVGGRKSRRRR